MREVSTDRIFEQAAERVERFFESRAVRMGIVLTGCAAIALCDSPFTTAASGVAADMITAAKWVGIILCIICAFGIMAGGPGAIAKMSGLVIGLVLALFATPIVNWVQSL